MRPGRILVGAAMASFSFAFAHAQAGPITDVAIAAEIPGDLIFDSDFEGQENGATSCAAATALAGDATYSADTRGASNWMSAFGPLQSPANDVVYMFVAGPDVSGSIVPTVSNYDFAMYLIPSCDGAGSQPQPIGATATLGRGIDLAAAGVISGNTYYLAITGSASGGAGANGTLNFTTPFSFAIVPRF